MKPELKHIVGIECLTVESSEATTAVVFFHGYGANMHDLFPLWEMWHKEKFSWFFPNGVQALPMGYYEGRAWFPIDMAALELALRNNTPRDMGNTIPPGFKEVINQLELMLLELNQKYKKVIIGGFSQGAMCASHLAMRPGIKVDGLILLSGNLVAESLLPPSARALPFYQSHGSSDAVLPLSGAKLLERRLHQLNFQGKLHVFDGGHTIPNSVINEVKTFLHQFE